MARIAGVNVPLNKRAEIGLTYVYGCLLYTSDAADDLLCVDLGGRRSIKNKTSTHSYNVQQFA